MGAAQHAGILLPAVRLGLALVIVVVSLAGSVSAVPPDVTSLFPAGGALGEEVQVTATGTFANWPVQTWSSEEGVTLRCEKEKGKLTVAIAAGARPGIAWLRFTDAEGASTPRPFVVSPLPNLREREPNDAPKQAQQLAASAVVHGKFDKNGDADTYSIQLAAGQTFIAQLQANQVLGSPADGALQICAASGQVIATNQDAGSLDALLAFKADVAGTYLVRAFALPAMPNSSINFAGGELFIYRLTITTGPYADYSLPLAVKSGNEATPLKLGGWNVPDEAVNCSPPPATTTKPLLWTPPGMAGLIPLEQTSLPQVVASAEALAQAGQPIQLPACITGVLAKPRAVHRFTFTAEKGAKLAIGVDAAKLGFDLDPHLKLLAPDGSTVSEIDDQGRNADPVLSATLATAGNYTLEIRDTFHGGGPRHVYRLTIESPQPSVSLSMAAGNFLIEKQKTVEIPVTITRTNGHSDELLITAVDLPAGITAAEVTSAGKGDSAKQVKLVLTAGEATTAGTFRLVARNKDGGEIATATFSQTLGGSTFQHALPWVSVK